MPGELMTRYELSDLIKAVSVGVRNASPFGGVLYVNSAKGSDANFDGMDPRRPLKTCARALAIANLQGGGTAIIVAAGHTETVSVANGLLFSKPDIAVMGLGFRNRKPAITFAGATAADIQVAAAGARLINLQLVAGIDALAALVTCDAADCLFEDIVVVSSAAFKSVVALDFTANADRFRVSRLTSRQAVGAQTTQLACIRYGAADDCIIEDSEIVGDYETTCILNTAAALRTMLRRCTLDNSDVTPATGICVSYNAGTTGWLQDLKCGVLGTTATAAAAITSALTRKSDLRVQDAVVANEVAAIAGTAAT